MRPSKSKNTDENVHGLKPTHGQSRRRFVTKETDLTDVRSFPRPSAAVQCHCEAKKAERSRSSRRGSTRQSQVARTRSPITRGASTDTHDGASSPRRRARAGPLVVPPARVFRANASASARAASARVRGFRRPAPSSDEPCATHPDPPSPPPGRPRRFRGDQGR